MTTTIAPTTNAGMQAERAFDFLRPNPRSAKPRHEGLTAIRGSYYSVMGPRYLADVLETMGGWVESLKFAGDSFTLMPRRSLRELIELCHRHEVTVSTGGFIERVLTQGAGAVDHYIRECRELGFDIIELSSGFITLPTAYRRQHGASSHARRLQLRGTPHCGCPHGSTARSSPANRTTP
jgi:phosphosulfolactate synthase (CoM biosynthesis protein A)